MRHKSEELMQQILNYAEKFLLLNHRSPYTSEIADALGIVKSTVYRYLVEMNERGMLSYGCTYFCKDSECLENKPI